VNLRRDCLPLRRGGTDAEYGRHDTLDGLSERPQFQSRLKQEMARSGRSGRPFVVVVLEAQRGADSQPMRQRVAVALEVARACLREYDLAYKVFEDSIAAVLLDTDALGARSALLRLRNRLAVRAGGWRVEVYSFPEQAEEIRQLPALVAA
jgi:hypothetical protein